MAEPSNKLIPAKYVGHHAVQLNQRLSFNIDGTRRKSPLLERGDTIMMPEREILGFTLLHDPHMVKDPLDLGVGKRVLPEHAGLNAEQLGALGYEWHLGRTDFLPLEIERSVEAPSEPPQQQEKPVQPTPPSDPLTVLSNLSGGQQ